MIYGLVKNTIMTKSCVGRMRPNDSVVDLKMKVHIIFMPKILKLQGLKYLIWLIRSDKLD